MLLYTRRVHITRIYSQITVQLRVGPWQLDPRQSQQVANASVPPLWSAVVRYVEVRRDKIIHTSFLFAFDVGYDSFNF